MNPLDDYLKKRFLTAEQFAKECRLTSGQLSNLIANRLIPQPSYVVSQSTIESYVFGKMHAAHATDGEYFHPGNKIWVSTAQQVIARVGHPQARQELEQRFAANMRAALADLNLAIWRLPDSFGEDGAAIADGLERRIESMWKHFLHGTFGLCVADPISELAIARKEVLQEKLIALSDNGARETFSEELAQYLIELIEAYAKSTMPFSPIEYPTSSRKRLVDDLAARISDYRRRCY